VVLLLGCKGEDGEDGKVYFTLDWGSDINAVDLSNVIKEDISTISRNTRYELEPGVAGYVYWRSNTTWYQLWVEIEDAEEGEEGGTSYIPLILQAEEGEDGKDRIYELYVTGNTLYVNDEYLESIALDLDNKESIIENIKLNADTNNAMEGFSDIKHFH